MNQHQHRSPAKQKSWTEAEMTYLYKNAKTTPVSELAKYVGRTVAATKTKVNRMGLSYDQR